MRPQIRQWLAPLLAVAIAVQLVVGLTAVTVEHRERADAQQAALAATGPGGTGGVALPAPAPPAGDPPPADGAGEPGPAIERDVPVPSPDAQPAPAPTQAAAPAAVTPPTSPRQPPQAAVRAASAQYSAAGQSDSERIFAQEYPAQAAARQVPGDAATHHWAVIVGVNRYMGRVRDTLGSVADAITLRDELLKRGWNPDHILVLLDHDATHDRVVRGIEWLIRKTDGSSTVVFSFSGHIRHTGGRTGLWPTDSGYLWDADFGRMMAAVPAGRMWVSLQGCHAAGMATSGLERPGRVVTYSSAEAQKSYEDPEVGHSVAGWFMFAEGIRDGWADTNGDGRISVQDAYRWAEPRAFIRTSNRQSIQLFDGYGRDFFLEVGG